MAVHFIKRAVQYFEALLWAAGFAALGYCGFLLYQAKSSQAEGNRELDRLLNARTGDAVRAPKHGALVGRVGIPRLHLSAVVFEGADQSVLNRGVGHVSGSALPGETGNIVLAAHRDTFFRPLRQIRRKDIVTVQTPTGRRDYQVDSIRIVSPQAVDVEAPTNHPTLTLITCYPFSYIGHAPKRFVVKAEQTGVE